VTRERLAELAGVIVATLDGLDPAGLHGLAAGLRVGGGPAGSFSGAIESMADGAPALAALQVRAALKVTPPGFAERLKLAETPFWTAVREALLERDGRRAA
jgi:hypothetical protein